MHILVTKLEFCIKLFVRHEIRLLHPEFAHVRRQKYLMNHYEVKTDNLIGRATEWM
jgi:hypothetical protein